MIGVFQDIDSAKNTYKDFVKHSDGDRYKVKFYLKSGMDSQTIKNCKDEGYGNEVEKNVTAFSLIGTTNSNSSHTCLIISSSEGSNLSPL